MSGTKVIIVGAGIAGPVLAIFLKMKGYAPIIYERLPSPTEAGLSFMLQPNGLRVLSLIPGLIDKIPGYSPHKQIHCSSLNGTEEVLVDEDLSSSTMTQLFGFPLIGTRRTEFHRLLIETAQQYGIEVVWGHQAMDFEQTDDDVRVKFTNETSDTASFVVGCDGLHSNTRTVLFGREKANFTGLVQFGGLSPTPAVLQGKFAFINNYGDGRHMVAYPVSPDRYSWAVTIREPEAKEDWRSQSTKEQDEIRRGSLSDWGFGAGELAKTGEKIIKFGLYDRPELESWFKGRVVLLGDAAHPTSPHLGQGANQAFEDIYHLVRILNEHNPSASQPSTKTLGHVFQKYQGLRLPITTELVKGARRRGEARVISGVEACKRRNELVKSIFSDEGSRKAQAELLSGPFRESEL
ncbi:FAD/NAD(P)-binding domain-containing protein [Gyrodon lividus]|nr:FAD/NAD(P)-binding domain-containing protein [Gyrodon lividus]